MTSLRMMSDLTPNHSFRAPDRRAKPRAVPQTPSRSTEEIQVPGTGSRSRKGGSKKKVLKLSKAKKGKRRGCLAPRVNNGPASW